MIFIYTPEERAQLEAIERIEYDSLQVLAACYNTKGPNSPEFKQVKQEHTKTQKQINADFEALMDSLDAARFAQLTTPAAILQDAIQQAQDAIVYAYVRIQDTIIIDEHRKGKTIVNLEGGGLYNTTFRWDFESAFTEQKKAIFNPDEGLFLLDGIGMSSYILQFVLWRHVEALKDTPFEDELQEALARILAESPYIIDTSKPLRNVDVITPDNAIFKTCMPVFHSKATDALAGIRNKDFKVNSASDLAIIQTKKDGYKIVIQKYSKKKGKYNVNTHKLLLTGIAEFTRTNNYGGGRPIPRVVIPFDEYVRLLGYDIDERETNSPEAAEKERKRAINCRKNAHNRVKQDLEILDAIRLTWNEKIKGKNKDFDSIALFDRIAIKRGYIIMEFGRNMSEILKHLPISQYHRGLLTIDARSQNAYRMGLKMAEHANMDNNIIKGTANRLRVRTLLMETDLPTIEMLRHEKQDNSRQWYVRTKEPFENALETLTGKVISNWEYVKPKGEPLTDEEAYNITDYETFIDLLVQFEIKDAPDHSERLARRAEEKAVAGRKRIANR